MFRKNTVSDIFTLFSTRPIARRCSRGQPEIIRTDTVRQEIVYSTNEKQTRKRTIQTFVRRSDGSEHLVSEKHILPYPKDNHTER